MISIRQPIVEFKDIPHLNYILSHLKCNEYCNAFRILGQIQELIADLNKSIKKADEIDLDDFGLYSDDIRSYFVQNYQIGNKLKELIVEFRKGTINIIKEHNIGAPLKGYCKICK